MAEVAERAGITRMTAYRHFSSRTALLLETVSYVDRVQDSSGRFLPVEQSPSGVEALDRWVGVWADYVPSIERLAHALIAARTTDGDAATAWTDRMAALHASCRRVVKRLDRDGMLSLQLDEDRATDLMWALASVEVWTKLTQDRGWSNTEYREELGRSLRAALVKGNGHGHPGGSDVHS